MLDGRVEGRGAVIVPHWTDVYCPVVLQHPRSCGVHGGRGAETLPLGQHGGTSIWYCFLEPK